MLHRGDAVGRHTLRLRQIMAERGIDSRIFVETIDPDTEYETEPYIAYDELAEPGDVLIYQFATASGLAAWLAARRETLVVNYHNVTPPEQYAYWDNGLALHQVVARQQLSSLARHTRLAVAVSAYNEAELHEAGFAQTAVVPPAAMLAVSAPAPARRQPPATGTRWLSVGRLAPNKALQHAVMALLITRAHADPEATLSIIGRSVVPAFTAALRRFIDVLGLHDAVHFNEHADDRALAQAMAEADVLVLTSAHEGFGVPVVEAMAQGLPVVANAAAALPDVVGSGGLLVDAADPWALAGAVATVCTDAGRRAELVAAGAAQVASLDLEHAGDRLVDLVAALR
jgi:glycosyltransferase involved in cell wall biosynthesis